jgi:hypothetical protein
MNGRAAQPLIDYVIPELQAGLIAYDYIQRLHKLEVQRKWGKQKRDARWEGQFPRASQARWMANPLVKGVYQKIKN